jgi:hypothetical protein
MHLSYSSLFRRTLTESIEIVLIHIVLNNYIPDYYKGSNLLLQLILLHTVPQIILKHKLMADRATFFDRHGDTDGPKQNYQTEESPKCYLPTVRKLDAHPFENMSWVGHIKRM